MSGVCRVALASAVFTMALLTCACASVAEGPYRPSVYGLYTWAGDYVRYADDVQKVGIRWIRCGGWTGEDADRAALAAAKNGVHIAPTLGMRELSHDATMPVDEAVAMFREQVRANVRRYGPGGTLWKENPTVQPLPIRYWEIWNEPNIEFLNPGDSGLSRSEFYAKLLVAASDEIRKADPSAWIIAFNTAGGTPYEGRGLRPDGQYDRLKYIGWRKFIRDVNDLVGSDIYDAIGTHPYTQPRPPDGRVPKGVEMIRELAKEQEFDKPIWFTEVGYPVEYPRNLQVRDRAQQAAFTTRLYALAAAHGVAQAQIMYIVDIIYGPDNSRRAFGFFGDEPGVWHEQATVTEVMIDLIPDAHKSVKIMGGGSVPSFDFEGAGGLRVWMAWTNGDEAVRQRMPVHGPVTLVTMLGETSTPEVFQDTDGRRVVDIILGEAPTYLVFAGKAEVDALLKD